ncbi:MAG: hypothetical protein ABJH45_12590 [Paracoccaceae bacterium]
MSFISTIKDRRKLGKKSFQQLENAFSDNVLGMKLENAFEIPSKSVEQIFKNRNLVSESVKKFFAKHKVGNVRVLAVDNVKFASTRAVLLCLFGQTKSHPVDVMAAVLPADGDGSEKPPIVFMKICQIFICFNTDGVFSCDSIEFATLPEMECPPSNAGCPNTACAGNSDDEGGENGSFDIATVLTG